MQGGVKQDGSIHLSSPTVCCGRPRGKGPRLGRREMLGEPPPVFAGICLPWAAGDTVPTACSKKTILFAVSDFSPAAAPAAPCWQERRGEERRGEVRGGRMGSSAHALAVDARSQPGLGPRRRALAALGGGDGVWIAGDASKHPRVRSDTRLAPGQGAVLFALALGKQSAPPGKCHPPHPATLAPRCQIFHLAFPLCRKGKANSHASSPGRRRGWIHLAERRGSHRERGAGRSAERIHLQRLRCLPSPV